MSQIHLFSEVDLDLTKEANKVYEKLFDICEEIGFMPSKEKYGFSVVGPFNINDKFDGEMSFQIKKFGDFCKVTDVFFTMRDNETRKITNQYHIVKDSKPTLAAEALFL